MQTPWSCHLCQTQVSVRLLPQDSPVGRLMITKTSHREDTKCIRRQGQSNYNRHFKSKRGKWKACIQWLWNPVMHIINFPCSLKRTWMFSWGVFLFSIRLLPLNHGLLSLNDPSSCIGNVLCLQKSSFMIALRIGGGKRTSFHFVLWPKLIQLPKQFGGIPVYAIINSIHWPNIMLIFFWDWALSLWVLIQGAIGQKSSSFLGETCPAQKEKQAPVKIFWDLNNGFHIHIFDLTLTWRLCAPGSLSLQSLPESPFTLRNIRPLDKLEMRNTFIFQPNKSVVGIFPLNPP